MTLPFRLGIAGLGTVGTGVLDIIQQHAALLSQKICRDIDITAVSARTKHKERNVALSDFDWEQDPIRLASRTDIDVFIELIGGTEGVSKDAIEAALISGKDVITANKAMLAIHGLKLAELAEKNNCCIRYEAAVAGGIPVIKALQEGLIGNNISRVMGVMNGTCNYILTRMEKADMSYEEAFKEADALGFLEADPNLDIGGIDAGHKLAILSAIAFGCPPNFDTISVEGIDQVTIEDIKAAADMGFKIKLLGVAQKTTHGLEQRMQPCLVPALSPIGQLEGGTNMVVIEGNSVEQLILRGPGAGKNPTASAVVSDICDLARGWKKPTFGLPVRNLLPIKKSLSDSPARYYLRMLLLDESGTLAKITKVLSDNLISIDRMRQYGHDDKTAPVLIVTHTTTRNAIDRAIAEMTATKVTSQPPVAFRIEDI